MKKRCVWTTLIFSRFWQVKCKGIELCHLPSLMSTTGDSSTKLSCVLTYVLPILPDEEEMYLEGWLVLFLSNNCLDSQTLHPVTMDENPGGEGGGGEKGEGDGDGEGDWGEGDGGGGGNQMRVDVSKLRGFKPFLIWYVICFWSLKSLSSEMHLIVYQTNSNHNNRMSINYHNHWITLSIEHEWCFYYSNHKKRKGHNNIVS